MNGIGEIEIVFSCHCLLSFSDFLPEYSALDKKARTALKRMHRRPPLITAFWQQAELSLRTSMNTRRNRSLSYWQCLLITIIPAIGTGLLAQTSPELVGPRLKENASLSQNNHPGIGTPIPPALADARALAPSSGMERLGPRGGRPPERCWA